jgi:hypothetical protein
MESLTANEAGVKVVRSEGRLNARGLRKAVRMASTVFLNTSLGILRVSKARLLWTLRGSVLASGEASWIESSLCISTAAWDAGFCLEGRP